MASGPSNLDDAESKARDDAIQTFGAHLILADRMYNLVGSSFHMDDVRPLADVTLAERVCTNLLNRSGDDLRCVILLARNGYSLQACALASSLFETAYNLAYIRDDESLAEKWVDHDDPTHSFRSVWDLVLGVMLKECVDQPEGQAKLRYRDYRQLCWAKHLNPLLQQKHGVVRERIERGAVHVFQMGPNAEEHEAVQALWFAIDQAVGTMTLAYKVYVTAFHGWESLTEAQRVTWREINERRRTLRIAAGERYGTEDPFAGRW